MANHAVQGTVHFSGNYQLSFDNELRIAHSAGLEFVLKSVIPRPGENSWILAREM
jgi:hypothetical protein